MDDFLNFFYQINGFFAEIFAARRFNFLPEETSRYMESLFMEVRNG